MQKVDVVLRQMWGEWCPSPGAQESWGMHSTANCYIALCPVGIGCYGQHITFETWTPLHAPEWEAIVQRQKIILKKINQRHLSCIQPVHDGISDVTCHCQWLECFSRELQTCVPCLRLKAHSLTPAMRELGRSKNVLSAKQLKLKYCVVRKGLLLCPSELYTITEEKPLQYLDWALTKHQVLPAIWVWYPG